MFLKIDFCLVSAPKTKVAQKAVAAPAVPGKFVATIVNVLKGV